MFSKLPASGILSVQKKEARMQVGTYIMAENSLELPKNFRLMDSLHISGSGQFTESCIKGMKHRWGTRQVIIVNLRQESCAYVNDHSLAWRNEKNNVNKGLSEKEVLADEKERTKELWKAERITAFVWEKQAQEEFEVKTVYSERSLVKKYGMRYKRYCVTDQEHPSDKIVDRFIKLVKNRKPDQWIHIHCEAGWGRTSTFLFIVDAMRNALTETFDSLVDRQIKIGGCNLKDLSHEKWKKECRIRRLMFAQKFYEYCRQYPNYDVKWSQFNTSNHEKSASP